MTTVKTCASETITGVKEYGMQSLNAVTDLGTRQMARALETPVCRQSVKQLDIILNVADSYVDALLPETGE